MATLTERRREARTYAGYRAAYLVDGHLAVVLHGLDSGIESDPENPWVVLCDDHSTIVSARTLADAKVIGQVGGTLWCESCRAATQT